MSKGERVARERVAEVLRQIKEVVPSACRARLSNAAMSSMFFCQRSRSFKARSLAGPERIIWSVAEGGLVGTRTAASVTSSLAVAATRHSSRTGSGPRRISWD